MGIIEKYEGATEWLSPIVPVIKKDGNIRICIDMRKANEAVERGIYAIPSVEILVSTIKPGTKFSKIDFSNAYFHFELEKNSRNITAFISTTGVYRFKRLLMGIKSAPEEYTKAMDRILHGLKGIISYMDDILVVGATDTEHDQHLNALLERLNNNNIRINKEKSIIGAQQVEFLGYRIDKQGIKPTHDKIETLRRFKYPTSKDEVKSFLGFLTFLSRFLPNLSTLTYPLRILLKKGKAFEWGSTQCDAFNRIKELITEESHLVCFDPSKKTRVVTDASPVGLGAILMQEHNGIWRPVAYASKGLTPNEMKFSQTEKEALGIVWAVEKFHYFLFGIKFQIVTDCKVLKLLFGPNAEPNARIQRWALRLQVYDYEVVFIPGTQNVADALSRLVEFEVDRDVPGETVLRTFVETVVPKSMSLSEIKEEIRNDEVAKNIKAALCSNDWSAVDPIFRALKRQICEVDGILLKGDKIIIPKSLEKRILILAHEGHPGQARMKMRLRSKVWMPRLEAKVAMFVKGCKGCIMSSLPDCPPPMRNKTFPDGPFEDIVIDYKQIESDMLLLFVDYYSRYTTFEVVKPATALETTFAVEKVCGLFGIPKTIQCDNGTHFKGEFIEFCDRYNIKIINSAPLYPQANGEVERFNREIEQKVKIAAGLGLKWASELSKFLLVYHATPHPALGGRTPSEAHFQRNIRDILPDFNHDRKHPDDEEMRDANTIYKFKSKEYTDKKRRAVDSEIEIGDTVMIKNYTKKKGVPNFGPQEYQVVDFKEQVAVLEACNQSQQRLLRHPTHMKKLQAQFEEDTLQPEHGHVNVMEMENTTEEEPSGIRKSGREKQKPKKLEDYVLYWVKQGVFSEDNF